MCVFYVGVAVWGERGPRPDAKETLDPNFLMDAWRWLVSRSLGVGFPLPTDLVLQRPVCWGCFVL